MLGFGYLGLIIILILFVFSACVLLLPFRLQFHVQLNSLKNAEARLKLRPVFGLLFIGLSLKFNILDAPNMTLYLEFNKKSCIIWTPGNEPRALGKINIPTERLISRVHLKQLQISLEAGIADDAFATAMLSGVLCQLISLPLFFLPFKPVFDADTSFGVYIRPAFNENKLLLKLTGIVSFIPIHIISAIIFWRKKD